MSNRSPDEAFLEEVVLASTQGLLTVDDEGRIVYVNEPARRRLEIENDGIVGESVSVVVGEITLSQIREATERETVRTSVHTDSGRVVPVDVRATHRNDTQFYTLTLHEPGEQNHSVERPISQLVQSGGEPLVLFDPDDGTVVDSNRETQELLSTGSRDGAHSVKELVDTPSVFVSFLQDVATTGEGRREEFTWQFETETRAVEIVGTPIESRGEQLVFARLRDVTEQNTQQAQRRRRTAALDTVQEGVAVLDHTYEHAYVNEAYVRLLATDAGTSPAGEPLEQYVRNEQRFETNIRPTVERNGRWSGRLSCETATGETRQVHAVFEQLEDRSVVLVVRDSVEDDPGVGHPDQRMELLDEVRRRLVAAQNQESVADICLEAVTDGFEYDLACVWRETDNDLKQTVQTQTAAELIERNPGFGLGRSDAGRAYRTGEPVFRRWDKEAAAGDLLATSLHFPLGDYGVLTVATKEHRTVPARHVDGLTLLATSAEAVLDRIDTEQQQGPEQSQQRGHVTTSTALTQEVISEIITADSPSAVQQQVCSKLVGSDRYTGAWIAGLDPTGKQLQFRESAGTAPEVRKAINDTPVSALADGTVATALETGEITVLNRATLIDGSTSGACEADTVVIVPLEHGDKTFGVLSVQVTDADSFDLMAKRSLSVLGDTISFVLSAQENERLLLSDEFIQLEFQVTDPSCLSVALSEKLDTAVTMRRTIQKSDHEYLSYVRLEDVPPEEAVDATAAIETVNDCRVISDYEYGCLLEVTRESSGAKVMMEYGATMRNAEAEGGRGTLVLEAPPSADIRGIVDAYQSYNPQSELVTKRRVDRPLQTPDQLRSEIENELTEKQLSAVSSAYYSGYYEWPRESTAEEVANSIGISSSTLHQHLRHAHRKLLTAILEGSFSRRF